MTRTRILLVAGVALAAAIFLASGAPEPAEPLAAPPSPSLAAAPRDVPAAEAPAGRPAARAPAPAQAPAPAPVPAAVEIETPEGRATVVEIRPGDEVPEPERPDPLPQVNDPIEPELPQTPEWRRGKAAHIASVLDRHVDRLAGELEAARVAGDREKAARLAVQVERQRKRLAAIRAEAEAGDDRAEASTLP